MSVPSHNTATLSRIVAANITLAPVINSVIQFDTAATTSISGDTPISRLVTGAVSSTSGLLKLSTGEL